MKKCTRCGIEKSESEFHKCSRLSDGLQVYCKLCINEYKTQWRRERATPEQIAWRQRIAENRELVTDGKKKCSMCKLVKSLRDFNKGEGTGDRRGECAKCFHHKFSERSRQQNKIRNAAKQKAMRKIKYLIDSGAIKRPNICSICESKPVTRDGRDAVLHFHHTDGYSGANVAMGVFVCAICHKNIHIRSIRMDGIQWA